MSGRKRTNQANRGQIMAIINQRSLIHHQDAFRLALEQFGISQAKICKRASLLCTLGYGRPIDTAQLSRWLQGKRDMELTTLQTLELALAFPANVDAYSFYLNLLADRDLPLLAAYLVGKMSANQSIITNI